MVLLSLRDQPHLPDRGVDRQVLRGEALLQEGAQEAEAAPSGADFGVLHRHRARGRACAPASTAAAAASRRGTRSAAHGAPGAASGEGPTDTTSSGGSYCTSSARAAQAFLGEGR